MLPERRIVHRKERDSEFGLDNFGARYNASSLGRFVTPDWTAKPTNVPYAHFGNPQSLNLYRYVQNNPDKARQLLLWRVSICWPKVVCQSLIPARESRGGLQSTSESVRLWSGTTPLKHIDPTGMIIDDATCNQDMKHWGRAGRRFRNILITSTFCASVSERAPAPHINGNSNASVNFHTGSIVTTKLTSAQSLLSHHVALSSVSSLFPFLV